MNRTARNIFGAAFLLAVIACAVDIAFDIPKDVQIDATGTSVNTVVPVDLNGIKEVQDHKANVQHLSLQSVDATVTVVAAANKAQTVSGTMSLRPSGATDASKDVLVGTLTNVPIVKDTKVHLSGSPALDDFMLQTLKGNGTFSAVISGTTVGGEAHLTMNAILHASMTYSSGL
jgi:hypothetical protein